MSVAIKSLQTISELAMMASVMSESAVLQTGLSDGEILAAFEWSTPKEIMTKRGERILRKAPDTALATAFWRAHQSELAAAGVTYGKKWQANGNEFCWWKQIDKAVAEKRDANIALSRATDAEMDIPCPEGKVYLGYQKAGVAFAKRVFDNAQNFTLGQVGNAAGVLLGDEMGLGKTIQAIGIINAICEINRVLIICPSKLKLNWYRELRTWLTKKITIGIVDADCWPSTDIAIVNFDILHKFQRQLAFMWDLLVIDECHKIKNPKARRSQAIIGYRPRRDEDSGLAKSGIPARRKLAMTGTPICNRREELWPIVSYLDPVTFNNWWTFNRKMSLNQVQEKLRSTLMIRRLKKDVLLDLPPKRRQVIPLPPDLDASDMLRRERGAVAQWEDRIVALESAVELAKCSDDFGRYKSAVAALKEGVQANFTEISRIRHETALAKLPLAKTYIEDMLEETEKLIILAHHRDVIENLEQAFAGVGALKIYGGMDPTESQRAVDLFQNDANYRVIIVSISVAVGMTLTAASNVVAVELDWVPGNMSQAEDRAHRIGQRDSVNVFHLVLEGSLDQNMAETLIAKQTIIDAALDNVAPTEEASEPITPLTGKRINFKRDKIAKDAEAMTPSKIGAVHQGLKILAGRCDGAQQLDRAGFSKVDAAIGDNLSDCLYLTPKQAVLGRGLCVKYGRQMPVNLLEQMK